MKAKSCEEMKIPVNVLRRK